MGIQVYTLEQVLLHRIIGVDLPQQQEQRYLQAFPP